ncbi:hypothetical protein FACI_IFERC00001G0686 [Ferroplasma acidarmanus Fer1]|uniref:Transposase n=1 Tax=Ferroplasma acidarmanus Fer1 TaxID=333146 RepID=S0AP31_FERAC|nr:hypothetical protein FACI_IFERC00001G0686 [Ferroplasma acidarmanus Fer1]
MKGFRGNLSMSVFKLKITLLGYYYPKNFKRNVEDELRKGISIFCIHYIITCLYQKK